MARTKPPRSLFPRASRASLAPAPHVSAHALTRLCSPGQVHWNEAQWHSLPRVFQSLKSRTIDSDLHTLKQQYADATSFTLKDPPRGGTRRVPRQRRPGLPRGVLPEVCTRARPRSSSCCATACATSMVRCIPFTLRARGDADVRAHTLQHLIALNGSQLNLKVLKLLLQCSNLRERPRLDVAYQARFYVYA